MGIYCLSVDSSLLVALCSHSLYQQKYDHDFGFVVSTELNYQLATDKSADVEMLSSGVTYVVSRRRILAYDGFLLQYFL